MFQLDTRKSRCHVWLILKTGNHTLYGLGIIFWAKRISLNILVWMNYQTSLIHTSQSELVDKSIKPQMSNVWKIGIYSKYTIILVRGYCAGTCRVLYLLAVWWQSAVIWNLLFTKEIPPAVVPTARLRGDIKKQAIPTWTTRTETITKLRSYTRSQRQDPTAAKRCIIPTTNAGT